MSPNVVFGGGKRSSGRKFAHAQEQIMAGVAGSFKSSAELSAEQLRRIEENKRRAREKLARRGHGEPPPRNTAHQSTRALKPLQNPGHSTGANAYGCSFTANSHNYSSGTKDVTGLATKPDTSSRKCVELVRPKIKANLRLASKQRFEIVIPYDKQAIEIFKKTPTNSYSELTNNANAILSCMYSQQMLKGQYGALELQSTISLVSFMTESDTHKVSIIP